MVRSLSDKNGPLEKYPWTKRALIKDLALGDGKHEELAKKYGVTRESIGRFKKKHAFDIAEAINDAEEEFAGILISQKAVRLGVYQQQLEIALDNGDGHLIARLLRQAAEEMGHLPSRVQVTGSVGFQTSYVITGEDGKPIDMENLK
jgi:hypothetical protein